MPDDPNPRVPNPRVKGLSLSLATYNIHRCFGTDGRYAPERTAEIIDALDADVVGLQEVDMRLLVDGRAQLDFLADTLRMTAIPGPNLKGRRGKFGNAMLTRLPVEAVCRTDLTVRHFEPRGAVIVRLRLGGPPLRVVVTHLGLNVAERGLQVRRLMAALEENGEDIATVIMGDFNEWRPTRGALRLLDRRYGTSLMPRTFPSRMPLLPLDRVWAWPSQGLKRLTVYATPLSRITSDHLPLRAEVAWDTRELPGGWRGNTCMTNV